MSDVSSSVFISWCRIEARNANRRYKYHKKKRGWWCRQAEEALCERDEYLHAAGIMQKFVDRRDGQ